MFTFGNSQILGIGRSDRGAAGGADSSVGTNSTVGDLGTTRTHPANNAGGDTDHKCMLRYVTGHNGASPDKCKCANCMAADNCAVRPKRGAAPDACRTELVFARHVASRV